LTWQAGSGISVIADDTDADAVIRAKDAQVDVAITADRQAGIRRRSGLLATALQ
jgi:hypothetical protein